jgi:hypothetical protein
MHVSHRVWASLRTSHVVPELLKTYVVVTMNSTIRSAKACHYVRYRIISTHLYALQSLTLQIVLILFLHFILSFPCCFPHKFYVYFLSPQLLYI